MLVNHCYINKKEYVVFLYGYSCFLWSNWSEAFGFGTIERRRLVKVKELGNGTCRVVRETKERRELNNKIRIVFKMSLSNISVL
jgi:hypothetical protein